MAAVGEEVQEPAPDLGGFHRWFPYVGGTALLGYVEPVGVCSPLVKDLAELRFPFRHGSSYPTYKVLRARQHPRPSRRPGYRVPTASRFR